MYSSDNLGQKERYLRVLILFTLEREMFEGTDHWKEKYRGYYYVLL